MYRYEGGKGKGIMNLEIEIDRYTLLCINR